MPWRSLVAREVPCEQQLVVHAPLGKAEWPDTIEHIEETIPPGIPLNLVSCHI